MASEMAEQPERLAQLIGSRRAITGALAPLLEGVVGTVIVGPRFLGPRRHRGTVPARDGDAATRRLSLPAY